MAGRQTTEEQLDRFLAMLAGGSTVRYSAKAADLGRSTVYELRKADEEFRAKWDEALEEGVEELEQEAVRRALRGSDSLLMFLLKAKRPDVYRENRRVEHAGTVETVDHSGARDRLLEKIAARAESWKPTTVGDVLDLASDQRIPSSSDDPENPVSMPVSDTRGNGSAAVLTST